MPVAAPNGVELYYETHGTAGDPLVLVHGYTGDVTDWRYQVAELSLGYRVLLLDHRGHGRSAAPAEASAYSIETMADDVEGLAERVGLARYHLVGHSMGGAVVQEIALRSPGKLLSLTLEDTSYGFRGHSLNVPENPPQLPPERMQQVFERLSRMSPDALRAGWKALISWQGTEHRAAAIRVPTLILCGERDAPFLVEGSRRLAELIPNAELHVIAGAGHCPQEETPEAYNALLRPFLRRHADAGAVASTGGR